MKRFIFIREQTTLEEDVAPQKLTHFIWMDRQAAATFTPFSISQEMLNHCFDAFICFGELPSPVFTAAIWLGFQGTTGGTGLTGLVWGGRHLKIME